MNAQGKGGNTLNQFTIRVTKAETDPDYTKTAPALLERCREVYRDPENEKAFREWMKEKEGKK